jgi:L-ascorbate metabolism protein UlaG (beta-lactamase superfamily)
MTTTTSSTTKITLVGGPTAVIDYAGLRIVTDPTFDAPSSYGPERHGVEGITLVKTAPPALRPEELGQVDLVLASHEHWDNLDEKGREFATGVAMVLGPEVVRAVVPNTDVLQEWDTREIVSPNGRKVTVTAVPAQHGAEGVWQMLAPVLGFVLTAEGEKTLYFSGDNASVDVVREIAKKFPDIRIAVINAGGARVELFGPDYISMSDAMISEVATVLTGATIVPIHSDSWEHFTQTTHSAKAAAAAHGVDDRVVALAPGEHVTL